MNNGNQEWKNYVVLIRNNDNGTLKEHLISADNLDDLSRKVKERTKLKNKMIYAVFDFDTFGDARQTARNM
jgi:hypothetical protein